MLPERQLTTCGSLGVLLVVAAGRDDSGSEYGDADAFADIAVHLW